MFNEYEKGCGDLLVGTATKIEDTQKTDNMYAWFNDIKEEICKKINNNNYGFSVTPRNIIISNYKFIN